MLECYRHCCQSLLVQWLALDEEGEEIVLSVSCQLVRMTSFSGQFLHRMYGVEELDRLAQSTGRRRRKEHSGLKSMDFGRELNN
jgi:hypothetical protein